MSFTTNIVIKESDVFEYVNFPFMVNELATIKKDLIHIPVYFKADIIISYLKNHSIKNDWIKANPELTKLITSGAFVTTHIESVFRACSNYKVFLHNFESYLRMEIAN
jgi:hypothetical protein